MASLVDVPVDVDFARSRRGSVQWEKNKGNTRHLDRYWGWGEGAAKIGWGKPCDFCSCVNHLRKYIPAHQLKGYCAKMHHRVLGIWPAEHDGHGRHSGKKCPC